MFYCLDIFVVYSCYVRHVLFLPSFLCSSLSSCLGLTVQSDGGPNSHWIHGSPVTLKSPCFSDVLTDGSIEQASSDAFRPCLGGSIFLS